MAAVSGSVLMDDGVPAFLVLLVLLLAISLVAVIRLPRWAGPSDDDTHDEPGHPPPKHARHTRAGTRPPETQAGAPSGRSVPASATGQSGEPDYPARHVTGPVHGRGTVASPKVSGSPPWDRRGNREAAELVTLSRDLGIALDEHPRQGLRKIAAVAPVEETHCQLGRKAGNRWSYSRRCEGGHSAAARPSPAPQVPT